MNNYTAISPTGERYQFSADQIILCDKNMQCKINMFTVALIPYDWAIFKN